MLKLLDFLKEKRHLNEIAALLNKGAGELSAMLLNLELEGAVMKLPSNFYIRGAKSAK